MVPGARARFADLDADVVNVSSSGALVRAARPQPAGSTGPLHLDINGTTVDLVARVVRCEPMAGPLSTSTGRFALAFSYVNPQEDLLVRLDELCQTRRGEFETRRVRVSLARRCPKCQSHDVAKEGRRSYSCCHCGLMFTGFRIGMLRFAR
jgi:hypothetical protein